MTKSLSPFNQYKISIKKKRITLILLFVFLLVVFFFSLLINSGGLSFSKSIATLFGIDKTPSYRLIIFRIRLNRSIAALIIGFALAISGLVMQINLRNPLASPSTLGVSSSALMGATISIILFNDKNIYSAPIFSTIPMALLFSLISIAFIIILTSVKKFSPSVVAVSGIAITSFTGAVTTILQFFANDILLASSVHFSFGDLSRANQINNIVMIFTTIISFIIFMFFSNKYNAVYYGDELAKSLGVNINVVRLVSLFFASLLCAFSVSFVGVIGFIGILSPHIMKRFIGNEARYLIPSSGLLGAVILIVCDILSRVIIPYFNLPVGAVTAIIGAPFFFFILVSKRVQKND